MYPNNPNTDAVADQASHAAQDAIKSTQGLVNSALNTVAGAAHDLREGAVPLVNRVSEQATAVVQRSADALRDGSRQMRDGARQASDATVGYIRDEPVKAMLIAAATGAALMALVSLMGRSRDRG